MLPIKDFLKKRKENGLTWPTKQMLYQLHFHNTSGFSEQCVRKLGRKMFIDETAFEEWQKKATTNIKPEKKVYKKKTPAKNSKENKFRSLEGMDFSMDDFLALIQFALTRVKK